MAIPNSYKDKEARKFIESQKRPGEPAVDVIISNPDEIATLDLATTPVITNLSLTTANVEFSHALQNGLKTLIIRSRGKARLQIAFGSGESSSKYITIEAGAVLSIDGLLFTGKTIYIQGSKVSTVEILEIV